MQGVYTPVVINNKSKHFKIISDFTNDMLILLRYYYVFNIVLNFLCLQSLNTHYYPRGKHLRYSYFTRKATEAQKIWTTYQGD